MISEKIELLGKGLYTNIPDQLTLQAIPTSSELDYVSAEDFDRVMLEKIFPKAIEEDINFNDLLEIDYQWICRCLRFINYGPYHTANTVYCPNCGVVNQETRVDLRTIDCKGLPKGFTNDLVVAGSEFIDFSEDIHLKLLTIKEALNSRKDTMFNTTAGQNLSYARLCYMVTQIGRDRNIDPVLAKTTIEQKLSSADYIILKEKAHELTNYGVRAGGKCICPRCNESATFVALVDDRFFRPSVGDLQAGRNDRSAGGQKESARD